MAVKPGGVEDRGAMSTRERSGGRVEHQLLVLLYSAPSGEIHYRLKHGGQRHGGACLAAASVPYSKTSGYLTVAICLWVASGSAFLWRAARMETNFFNIRASLFGLAAGGLVAYAGAQSQWG